MSNSFEMLIPEEDYDMHFETHARSYRDCSECGEYIIDCTCEPEIFFPCNVCDGRGVDRWEEEDCPECFGDGEIPLDNHGYRR